MNSQDYRGSCAEKLDHASYKRVREAVENEFFADVSLIERQLLRSSYELVDTT